MAVWRNVVQVHILLLVWKDVLCVLFLSRIALIVQIQPYVRSAMRIIFYIKGNVLSIVLLNSILKNSLIILRGSHTVTPALLIVLNALMILSVFSVNPIFLF